MSAILFFVLVSFMFMGCGILWGILIRIAMVPALLIADRPKTKRKKK